MRENEILTPAEIYSIYVNGWREEDYGRMEPDEAKRQAFKVRAENFISDFAQQIIQANNFSDPDQQKVIQDNNLQVGQMVFYLHSSDIHRALDAWKEDKVHSVDHSYDVFQKMKQMKKLAGPEDGLADIDDQLLELLAILHDFGEFLPIYEVAEKDGKKYFKKNHDQKFQATNHHKIIATAVWQVFRDIRDNQDKHKYPFDLDARSVRELVISLLYHDFFWSDPPESEVVDLGKYLGVVGGLLADADRLVGKTAEGIARNAAFAEGSSYAFLNLLPEIMARWIMRSGNLFDGFSCLFPEFSSPLYLFHTEIGRKMYEQRKMEFKKEMLAFYSSKYKEGWKYIEKLYSNEDGRIEIGVFSRSDKGWINGKKGITFEQNGELNEIYNIEASVKELDAKRVNKTDVKFSDEIRERYRQLFEEMVKIPISETHMERKNKVVDLADRQMYGYSVLTDFSEKPDQLIQNMLDPSLLQYKTVEELCEKISASFDAFVAYKEEHDDQKKVRGRAKFRQKPSRPVSHS